MSFWYRDVHPHDLATILERGRRGDPGRAPLRQLVMRRFGMPATARASFYVYNTKDEVDVLVEALAKAGEVFAV